VLAMAVLVVLAKLVLVLVVFAVEDDVLTELVLLVFELDDVVFAELVLVLVLLDVDTVCVVYGTTVVLVGMVVVTVLVVATRQDLPMDSTQLVVLDVEVESARKSVAASKKGSQPATEGNASYK